MTLQRKIDALFLVALLVFSGLFYTALQSSKYTRESSALVTQTHKILYNLEKVESSITAIEAAHRGFIISGKEEFLDPVENEKNELYDSLVRLDSLIGDNTAQAERLEQLTQLIARKIEYSEHGASLRRKVNIETALGYVSTGKGKLVMDSLRSVTKGLEREEINSLNERTDQNEDFVIAQNRNYLLFSGFILLILFALYLRIRKNAGKLFSYKKKQDELIRELNYQNRQLDDFAHLTSHNIRSPAVNIFTLISFLNENSSLEDYKVIFEKLTKVSKNLNETLNELIEVLQVKNNTAVARENLSFEEVLTKVKESMEGDILLSHAEIASNFEKVANIRYPKTYLESIFHNLLSNAIKYRSSNRLPEIQISTYIENEQVALEVRDNGLGIDLDKYGHQIFGLRKTFHRNSNAKGIGLFMTKTQIEALGGEISVSSEPNKGTIFKVLFGANSIVEGPVEVKRVDHKMVLNLNSFFSL